MVALVAFTVPLVCLGLGDLRHAGTDESPARLQQGSTALCNAAFTVPPIRF